MKSTGIKLFLLSGLLIPIIFWSSTIIGGILYGNYNHFQNTVSQLGAIGAHSERFMTISTWICTILSLVFLVGLLKVCDQFKLNKTPLIGILGFAIMFGWAATFHSGNPLHSKAGPALLLLLLGPLLLVFLWKIDSLKKLRLLSLISFFIMLFILIRVIPSEAIQNNYTGLIQRFAHFGWTVWFISLYFSFLTITNNSLNSLKMADQKAGVYQKH